MYSSSLVSDCSNVLSIVTGIAPTAGNNGARAAAAAVGGRSRCDSIVSLRVPG